LRSAYHILSIITTKSMARIVERARGYFMG
jgi:hypothetical protein